MGKREMLLEMKKLTSTMQEILNVLKGWNKIWLKKNSLKTRSRSC